MATIVPAKKTPGRPPIDPDQGTQPITLRLTKIQREKLIRLGGPRWIRDRIDKAKEPTPKE